MRMYANLTQSLPEIKRKKPNNSPDKASIASIAKPDKDNTEDRTEQNRTAHPPVAVPSVTPGASAVGLSGVLIVGI